MTRVQHPQPGARAEQRSSPTLQTTIRQPTRWEHGAGLSLASSVYNTIQFEFGIPGEILILNHFNFEAVLLMINIITLTIYIGGHLNFSFALSQSLQCGIWVNKDNLYNDSFYWSGYDVELKGFLS